MPSGAFIDTILLIALPASGKSEVRKFLRNLPREDRIRDFHVSDTAQLDDFPYVAFLAKVDEEREARGLPRAFYEYKNGRFIVQEDWGLLLRLVSDDYLILKNDLPTPPADGLALFERIDGHRRDLGCPEVFSVMAREARLELADALQPAVEFLIEEQWGRRSGTVAGKTIVMECARGGADGAEMPLQPPAGYAFSLANHRPEVLENAAVLYIKVTPEESRRKNKARYVPGMEDSDLHHSAPDVVMYNDYGCDDVQWLIDNAAVPNTIRLHAHGRHWDLPIAVFDNTDDKTTFQHADVADWKPEHVAAVRDGLFGPMQGLWKAYQALRHG
jgi:hypothetical protein